MIRKTAELYRTRRHFYESGAVNNRKEIGILDYRLFITTAVNLCTEKAMKAYRRRAHKIGVTKVDQMWPFLNARVYDLSTVESSELKFIIFIYSRIKTLVSTGFGDCSSPLNILLGMSAVVGASTKMHHVMSRMNIILSYDTMFALGENVRDKGMRERALHGLTGTAHRLAIFSIDNLDTNNRHGILVSRKSHTGLHITAVEAVLSAMKYNGSDEILVEDGDRRRLENI